MTILTSDSTCRYVASKQNQQQSNFPLIPNHPSQVLTLPDVLILMPSCTAFSAIDDRFCIKSLIMDQNLRLFLCPTIPQFKNAFSLETDFTWKYSCIMDNTFNKYYKKLKKKIIINWNVCIYHHSQSKVNNGRNSCFVFHPKHIQPAVYVAFVKDLYICTYCQWGFKRFCLNVIFELRGLFYVFQNKASGILIAFRGFLH